MNTLVIGLDGLDDKFWDIKEANSLIDHHGELETYCWTLPSFMCSLTGNEYSPSLQGSFTSHRVFKHKMLWDYLGNMRQTYINIPPTYPAEEINGSFICGWKAKKIDSNSVKPLSLIDKLKNIDYYYGKDLFEYPAIKGDWKSFFRESLKQITMRTRAIEYLAEKDQSEFLFAVYTTR